MTNDHSISEGVRSFRSPLNVARRLGKTQVAPHVYIGRGGVICDLNQKVS